MFLMTSRILLKVQVTQNSISCWLKFSTYIRNRGNVTFKIYCFNFIIYLFNVLMNPNVFSDGYNQNKTLVGER